MGKIATGVKAGGGGTVLSLVTLPEDSAGLLRQAAGMIEGGEHIAFWLIGFVLLGWAAWDVWTWFRRERLSKTESEPSPPSGQITPKDTITKRGVLTLYESGYVKSLTPWKDLEAGKVANHPAGPREYESWRASPGAGRVVARAINDAQSLEDAHDIFDMHYASPNPKDTAWAAHVLLMRMEAAGENVMPLIHKLYSEGIDIAEHLNEINQEFGDGSS